MSAPTTVEEYLRQIPNPSPCPHSPTPADPPCMVCVERRISVANALRAGQDPTQALGLAPAPAGQAPVVMADAEEESTPPPTPASAPAVAPTPEPDPMLPGMTRTEVQPSPNDPPPQAAVAGAELLAQLTGGQVAAGEATAAPPGVAVDPLALTPEQIARRAEIEAGTHPAVAPMVEPEGINGHGALHDLDDQGSSERQAEVDVQAALQRNEQAPTVEEATAVVTPALPPPPEPAQLVPQYAVTQRNSVGQLFGWNETLNAWDGPIDEPARLLPPLPEAAYTEPQGIELPEQEHPGTGEAMTAVEAPTGVESSSELPTPDAADVIAEAAAIAAPVQVDPGTLTQHCEHNMPATDFSTTPPRSASCVECMNDGGPPPHMTKLRATRFQLAHLTTPCDRAMCNRTINPGEVIGYVDGVGWCCSVCTKPEQRAPVTT